MSLRAPRSLKIGIDWESFDCGTPVLNEWLVQHPASTRQRFGQAFVVADNDRVVGYFGLTVGKSIHKFQASTKGMDNTRSGNGRSLARLASSTQDQGKALALACFKMRFAARFLLPNRRVSVCCPPYARGHPRFYTRFGFIASPLGEQQLLLLLKDARHALHKAN